MSIKRIYRLLPLAVLGFGLALTGCDSNSPEDDTPSIGGTYIASETVEGTSGSFEVTFPDTDGGAFDLSGSLSIEEDDVTLSFPITGDGTYDFPDISMNFTIEAAGSSDSFQVSGTVSNSADLMTLTDNAGDTMTFRRQ